MLMSAKIKSVPFTSSQEDQKKGVTFQVCKQHGLPSGWCLFKLSCLSVRHIYCSP